MIEEAWKVRGKQDFRSRRQAVLSVARKLYDQDPNWVIFFREVLGMEGLVRRAFSDEEELTAFEASEELEEIQRMLSALRARRGAQNRENEPTHVLTVRIPKSMHEALLAEAESRGTSMNQLCISRLLQLIDREVGISPPRFSPRRTTLPSAMESSSGSSEDDVPTRRK